MEFEEVFRITDAVVFDKTGTHLNNVQMAILAGSWECKSYNEIATQYRYTPEYLKNDVGFKLWKLLSEVLGEKVSKKNFKAVMVRRSYSGETLPSQTQERYEEVIAKPHPESRESIRSSISNENSERRVDYARLWKLLAAEKRKIEKSCQPNKQLLALIAATIGTIENPWQPNKQLLPLIESQKRKIEDSWLLSEQLQGIAAATATRVIKNSYL